MKNRIFSLLMIVFICIKCDSTPTIPLADIKYHRQFIESNSEGSNKTKTFNIYERYLLDDEIGDSISQTPFIYYYLSKLEEDSKYLTIGLEKFPDDPYLNYELSRSDRVNNKDSLSIEILSKHPRFNLALIDYMNDKIDMINFEKGKNFNGEYYSTEEEFLVLNYNKITHLYELIDKFENAPVNNELYDLSQQNYGLYDSLEIATLNNQIQTIKSKYIFLQNRKPKPWDNEKLSLKSRILLFVENQLKNDLYKNTRYNDSVPKYFLKQGKEPVTIKLSEMYTEWNTHSGSNKWINYGFNSFNPDRNKNGVIDGTTYESDGTVKEVPYKFEVKIEFALNSQFKNQKCFDNFNTLGYITVEMSIDVNNPNKILWWDFGYVQDLSDYDLGDYFKLQEMFKTAYERYSMNDYLIRENKEKKININKTIKYWNTKSEFIEWFKSNTNPSNTEMNNCIGIRFD